MLKHENKSLPFSVSPTRRNLAIILLTSSLLTACGGASTKPQQVEGSVPVADASTRTLSAYESATNTYNQWLKTLNDAAPLQRYSPKQYEDMLDRWSEAVDIYQDFADEPQKSVEKYSFFGSATYAERFQEEIVKVDQRYNRLTALKHRADKLLAPAIEQMSYLEKIGTPKLYKQEYASLNKSFNNLFAYIEDKEEGDAQNKQSEFLHQAKKLEVKTVLKIHIRPLEKEISTLSSNGIGAQAPISFTKAKAKLSTAKQIATSTPRDIETIQTATAETQFEIDHTLHIAAEVQKLKALNEKSYENYILDFENQIFSISKALNDTDHRNLPLPQQTRHLTSLIQQQHATQQNLQTQLQQQRQTLEQLQSDKKSVETTQQQFNNLQQQLSNTQQQLSNTQQQLNDAQQKLMINRQELNETKQALRQSQQELSDTKESLQPDNNQTAADTPPIQTETEPTPQ